MNASLLVYGFDQPSRPHLVIALRFDMLGRSCQIPMLDSRNKVAACSLRASGGVLADARPLSKLRTSKWQSGSSPTPN